MTQEEKENKLEKLRTMVSNYDPKKALREPNQEENFVSLIAVEQVLKNYQNEFNKKIEEFQEYVSKLLGRKCYVKFEPTSIRQDGHSNMYLEINDSLSDKVDSKIKLSNEENNAIKYFASKETRLFNPKSRYYKKLLNDPKTNEFMNEYYKYCKKINTYNFLKTNSGLFINIFQSELTGLEVNLSDYYDTHYLGGYGKSLFSFHKNVITGERTLKYYEEECKEILNETQIADIYSTIKVDISLFPEELQEEMKKYETYYNLKLHEQANSDKNELKRMQQERLMQAYKEFKKSAEALNNMQMEVEFKKIKLNELETIFFKNSGQPNEAGYIEIDDMFKNNMMLRMLDLSDIDLTNVDIRNIDFSGTNIHINPQKVYNKDMTNVNATGLKFSPFFDSFDDVILDGAIITDWEAAINISKLRSYNNQTVIPDTCKNKKSINSDTMQM